MKRAHHEFSSIDHNPPLQIDKWHHPLNIVIIWEHGWLACNMVNTRLSYICICIVIILFNISLAIRGREFLLIDQIFFVLEKLIHFTLVHIVLMAILGRCIWKVARIDILASLNFYFYLFINPLVFLLSPIFFLHYVIFI